MGCLHVINVWDICMTVLYMCNIFFKPIYGGCIGPQSVSWYRNYVHFQNYSAYNKAVPDGSVCNIRSEPEGCFKFIQPRRYCAKPIHLVILQSLGDTTFFKRTVQTDDIHLVILQSLGDTTFFKRAVQTDDIRLVILQSLGDTNFFKRAVQTLLFC